MGSNESVQFFIRLVREKHRELVESLDRLSVFLVDENKDEKRNSVVIAKEKALDLKNIMSNTDCPAWLTELIAGLNYYINSQWREKNIFDYFVKNYETIKTHIWVLTTQ